MANHLIASDESAQAAASQLSRDPALEPIIRQAGLFPIRPHTDYCRELVESIIGQQLSVKAAATINKRFVELFSGTFPEPLEIIHKPVEQLRSAGLSGAKAAYVQDLARHILDGAIAYNRFDSMENEAIIKELVAVKGIGEWTAHMFLLFCMGRLDILPVGDFGVRTGIMRLYELDALPLPNQIRKIARTHNWHPYESVASWYIWQSLDS